MKARTTSQLRGGSIALTLLLSASCGHDNASGDVARDVEDDTLFDSLFGTRDVSQDTGGESLSWPPCIRGTEAGCACDANDDCDSGFCVDTEGGKICTSTCDTTCPAGFGCAGVDGPGGDVTFICVSLYTNLCRPCDSNADCSQLGGTGRECLAGAENAGSFCTGVCGDGGECPEGFSCEFVDVAGMQLERCVPADDAECGCTAKAIADGASTACARSNVDGSCMGVRTCEDEGLTACSARAPSVELCNSADDDCNGLTDDVGTLSCLLTNVYGSCSGTSSCIGGVPAACIGQTPQPEVCDAIDNDCNGLTDDGEPDDNGDGVMDACERAQLTRFYAFGSGFISGAVDADGAVLGEHTLGVSKITGTSANATYILRPTVGVGGQL